MRFKGFIIIALCTAIVVVLLGIVNIPELLTSVAPSSAFVHYTSKENYVLIFKLTPEAKNKTEVKLERKISEWHLEIPKAFLAREIGVNGAIGDGHSLGYSATLYAMPTDGDINFTPAVFEPAANQTKAFLIEISNQFAGEKIAKAKRCFKAPDLSDLYGSSVRLPDLCSGSDKSSSRCQVHYQFNGWHVQIMVPKKIYDDDYQKYCLAISHFLAEHTTSMLELPSTD